MWIETKNELPKTSESEPSIEVNVTMTDGDKNFSSALTFEDGIFKMDNGVDLTSEVIAWQYLPEPFNAKPPIEIKPGVYCDDIPEENQEEIYRDVYKGLVKLNNSKANDMESHRSYRGFGNIGWCKAYNNIYHAIDPTNKNFFTTRVSYKDIIAAAKAMEE